jgi:hypothetical protein
MNKFTCMGQFGHPRILDASLPLLLVLWGTAKIYKKLRGLSPQANYANRAIAACQ